MVNSRRSFIGSFFALLSGVPFLSSRKKVKETFAVQIEEIGDDRYRATLKTSGFFGHKIAVIDSPELPSKAYAKCARLFLLFEVQRAMKVHVFPEDTASWNNPMASAFSREAIPSYEPFSEEAVMERCKNTFWDGSAKHRVRRAMEIINET